MPTNPEIDYLEKLFGEAYRRKSTKRGDGKDSCCGFTQVCLHPGVPVE